jgi:hypothetical protein
MDTPAFDATRYIRPALRSIVVCSLAIVISSMTMVKPAQASGTIVQSAPLWCTNSSYPSTCIYPTKEAVCIALIGNRTDYYFGFLYYYPGGEAVGWTCWAYATLHPGDAAYAQRFGWLASMAVCPANSTGTTSCTCNDPYVPDTTQTSCVLPACPDHASSNPPGAPCACDVNYKFDAAGTTCVPAAVCPVDKLTTPPFNDACSTSLEKGKGVDVNNACGTLRKPDMVNAESCIAAKINAALINVSPVVIYTDPSATIRTTAYQNHLLEIWTKSQELNTIMNSVVFTPETKQACAPVNVDVNNEKAQHHIKYQPSSSGDAAPHVEHRAIDVPEAVSDALMDQVTTYTTTYITVNGQRTPIQEVASDVEDYMHSATVNPPACNPNLSWGGRFDSHDWIHFELP